MSFDQRKYKDSQRDQWDRNGEGWYRWASVVDRWFSPPTELMFEYADLRAGDCVLDIASGAGEPGLSAAARVVPGGSVLATDLSEGILEFAARRARERGIQNFRTRQMDGEDLDVSDASFSVALCRFGLMFMPDRKRALREWYRALVPGGRAVVAVFSTPEKNDWGELPLTIIRDRAKLGPALSGFPGPFSLGDPGLIEQLFREAGFTKVRSRCVAAPLRIESAAVCARFERESFGAFNQMMRHLSDAERESVWDEVEIAMKRRETAEGLELSCEAIVCAGLHPND